MTYEETLNYLKEDLRQLLEWHWKHANEREDATVGEWLEAQGFEDEDGAEAAGWELGEIKEELEETDTDYAAARNMTAACVALEEYIEAHITEDS